METIGEFLRRVREQKGVSLEKIVKITKIRETYLRAIEENNKSTLPGEAYYRAFLRSYASCLGLDYEELKKQFLQEELSDKKNVRKESGTDKLKEEINESKINNLKIQTLFDKIFGQKIIRNTIFIFLVFTILYLISTRRSSHQEQKQEIVPAKEEVKSAENNIPYENLAKQDTTLNVKPVSEIKKEKPFTLTLIGIDTTWVRVKLDNKDIFEIFLKPQEKRVWTAKDKFELKVGDAGGLKVKINDKDTPPLGKRGQVVENIVYLREKVVN